jgi:hypothetical protein
MKWNIDDSTDLNAAITMLSDAYAGRFYDTSYMYTVRLTEKQCYFRVQQAMLLCQRILDAQLDK